MVQDTIYAGDDFSLCGEVTFDETDAASSLEEFEIRVQLSTAPLGVRIDCSSEGDAPIPVFRKGDRFFGINIPGSETARLLSGMLEIGVRLTHRTSRIRMYAEQQTIEVKEPKLKIKS